MKRNFFNFSQKVFFMLFALFLLLVSTNSFALPFNIVPAADLPTQVITGESVTASYTITNNTVSTRNNNFIKYLPPAVTQVTTGGAGTCGSTFNLTAKGQPGDSCVLQLIISGAVNANDPDQHHQLFACFPGGTTCAGTNQPLNVQLLPPALEFISISAATTPADVHVGQTLQFTATGIFSDGSTQDITQTANWVSTTANATITQGTATGVSIGASVISANENGINSNTIPLAVVSFAYVSNGGSGNISRCNINADGSLHTPCTALTGVPPFGTPYGINFSSSLSNVYVVNESNNNVSSCPVNADGSFGSCINTTGFSFTNPQGIALSLPNGAAFITNSSEIVACAYSGAGALGNCTPVNTTPTVFTQLSGITVDSEGFNAYVTDRQTSTIAACAILGGVQLACNTITGIPFSTPQGIALNSAETFIYVADGGSGVIMCNDSAGILSNCQTAIASGTSPANPTAIALNAANTFAYVSTTAGNVYRCTVTPNTEKLSGCTATTGFNAPTGIAVN